MEPYIIWGIIFLVLLVSELLTGTFYILMLALGAIVGGIFAFFGADLNWQIGMAALTAIATTALLHYKKFKNPKAAIYSKNKDVIIDIGERVEVKSWDIQKNTQVFYRGALWRAHWIGQGEPEVGTCVIQGMQGSELMLDKV